jgi:carbonyl reductase 1
MMSTPLVIVVTGTSRGVGSGIVQVLAKQTLNRPLVIYATSRAGDDNSAEVIAPNRILHSKLETTDKSSIRSFFERVYQEHAAVDILINNAAVANDYRETPDYAAQTVWNNYGGTRDMCDAFLAQPNLKPGARIVNLTSGMNAPSTYAHELQTRFRGANSVADIDALANAYLSDMAAGPGTQERAGWGTGARSYKVSKALINTLTVVLAQQHPNVLINCCCPGWCNTDMGKQGKGMPPKTAEQGALTAVRCAIGDLGPGGDGDGGLGKESARVSGMFFENENIMMAGWGKGKRWLET